MSNIIYIKDILLKRNAKNKKTSGRPRLKPFDQESVKMKIKRGTSGIAAVGTGIVGVSGTEKKQVKRPKTTVLRSSLTEQQRIKSEK